MTTVRELADRVPASWRAATQHPFLDGARSGELPARAFDRWLEQDRHFVETLTRSWGAVLERAPRDDLPLLADGIGAFVAELAWFDGLATERDLADATVLPATAAYCEHLLRFARAPHPVAMAVMWTVEVAYLAAWRTARPGAPAYRTFVQHWTDDGFATFVGRVEAAANAALATASEATLDDAAVAVAATLEREAAFWAMTWSG